MSRGSLCLSPSICHSVAKLREQIILLSAAWAWLHPSADKHSGASQVLYRLCWTLVLHTNSNGMWTGSMKSDSTSSSNDDWVMSHSMPMCPSAWHFSMKIKVNSGPGRSKQYGWNVGGLWENKNRQRIINLYLRLMRPRGLKRLTFLDTMSTCLIDRKRSNPLFFYHHISHIYVLFKTSFYFNTDWSLDEIQGAVQV